MNIVGQPIINTIGVLSKFANCFDLKDWKGMDEILADSIECDYSDFRKSTGIISRCEFVKSRKEALANLKTHHLFSNFEVTTINREVCCKLSAIIYRVNSSNTFFNSHAIYEFTLKKIRYQKLSKQ